MNEKRLRKLRDRAFEAGILGSSKMDEHQLLEALARHKSMRTRAVFGLRSTRHAGHGG
jgi:hypothetical protein